MAVLLLVLIVVVAGINPGETREIISANPNLALIMAATDHILDAVVQPPTDAVSALRLAASAMQMLSYRFR